MEIETPQTIIKVNHSERRLLRIAGLIAYDLVNNSIKHEMHNPVLGRAGLEMPDLNHFADFLTNLTDEM